MKSLIVYSSKTGNTRKVAEAILSVLPAGTEIYPVENAPDPDAYDFVAVGYWVDKGTANAEMAAYMPKIRGKKVGIFFTLGAFPHSEHAQESCDNGIALLGENCEVVATFRCQGAIDPKLTAWMSKLPKEHPHAPNPERLHRWAEAAKHPDAADLEAAKNAFRNLF
ncbi:MAG: flavodoxin family protein [Opitutales bacterium]|nr:flavodoxin family protein [Opitutales bacterium]